MVKILFRKIINDKTHLEIGRLFSTKSGSWALMLRLCFFIKIKDPSTLEFNTRMLRENVVFVKFELQEIMLMMSAVIRISG